MMNNLSVVGIQRCSYDALKVVDCVQPLGGFSRFCSRGDQVVVKLNLLNASDPSEGVVTHPAMVKTVCEAVLKQNAIPVIGDSPSGSFTKRRLEKVYRKAGLLSLAHGLGVEVNYDTRVVKVEIPDGRRLQKTSLCRFIVDADRVIAIPKLKTHSLMMLTGASKIMFGAIPGLVKASYHSRFIRRNAFADMLLDVLSVAPADLFLLDGVTGMQGDGPSG
ncbi:MAG: DUF362 domain-containing protein [Candidatus Thermoplasmatota archaeon]|nr:DUF362 domain-containing protein [Candidatus Thermoplasmatota archaeon]